MTDIVDIASALEAEHLARSLARVDRVVAAGVAGDCAQCGEAMPRLIGGRCGFCRDGRTPPPSFYRDDPVANFEEPPVTITVPTRKISFEGDALAAIDSYADQTGCSFKNAATALILASGENGPSDIEIAVANLPDVALVDELRRRLLDESVTTEDYRAETARADAAEAKLASLKGVLLS